MTRILFDLPVVLDLFEEDSEWVEWLETMLLQCSSDTHDMYTNSVIYSEVSIGFKRI